MKLKTIIIAILAATLLTFSVSAAGQTTELNDGKIKLSVPDGFTVIDNGATSISENKTFIGTLGHSTDSFSNYMKESNMIMFAATADNTKQIQVKSWITDFSEGIDNLALFSDDEDSLNKAAQTLSAEGENETLVSLTKTSRADGTLFIKIEKLVHSERDFSYLQYVTIIDGSYYSLVYYNFGGSFTDAQRDEASQIFSSLSIEQQSSISLTGTNNVLNIVILWVAIAAIAIFSVILLFSLIKDLLERKEERERTDEKIERRKFK